MPREGTHWAVLDSALSEIESSASCPAVTQVVNTHRAACYWGAIYQDVPYYLEGDDAFEKIADHLHGVWRTDTFDPARELSQTLLKSAVEGEQLTAACWAFIIAGTTHVIVDSVFHPLVVYYTGDYYEKDSKVQKEVRRRHRLIESYLDLWITEEHHQRYGCDLSTALEDLQVEEKEIAALLVRGIDEYLSLQPGLSKVNTVDRWLAGLSNFKKRQRQFRSSTVATFLRVVNGITLGSLRAEEAMFLPGRKHYPGALDKKIDYCCPVTGAEFTHSFRDLFDESVNQCVSIIESFESLICQTGGELPDVLSGAKGNSMDLGTYRAASEDGRFFSSSGLPFQGLEGACPSFRP